MSTAAASAAVVGRPSRRYRGDRYAHFVRTPVPFILMTREPPHALDSGGAPASRREFLAATASAVGLSSGLFGAAAEPDKRAASRPGIGQFEIVSGDTRAAGAKDDLLLRFTPDHELPAGSRIWLFFEPRQGARAPHRAAAPAANRLTLRVGDNPSPRASVTIPEIPRTLDLFPLAPEFLHLVEITFEQSVAGGVSLDVGIDEWTGPQTPMSEFRFWMVVDSQAAWDFSPMDFRRYRRFVRRSDGSRVPTEDLIGRTLITAIQVTGEHPPISGDRTRRTAGVYWGEFHGMVFNQRPLDDYYHYARHVSRLDFCAPFWFSYNTCVADVWARVKDAAERHTRPGEFVAIAGFECGTPPDDSHRCVLFPDARDVPPIFCESRPPAQEPFFLRRLHPDTIVCRSTDELYEIVARHGGIVTGHFHTLRYDREVLAELFQKNLTRPDLEEQRIYQLLRDGKRFALAATSDTHDSMPGNPHPEPHLPMPAGTTAVLAEQLSAAALFAAVRDRRTYATTGARIALGFRSGPHPMGSALPLAADRIFHIQIDGTAPLATVELLRNGEPLRSWSPKSTTTWSIETHDRDTDQAAFYLVRVKQSDQQQAWTSPIWFG